MSKNELQILVKKFLIPMAKGKLSNLYDDCFFGKQHSVSFHKNSAQKLEKLELVYYDVYGRIEVDSLGGDDA